MSEAIFWVFYDTSAKIQSNFMSTPDAQASILKMRPQDVKRYLIWTAGWQNWQALKSYLESDQKNFVPTFTVSSKASDQMNEVNGKSVMREVLENTQTSRHKTGSNSVQKMKAEETVTKSYSSIQLDEETISRIVRQEKAELQIGDMVPVEIMERQDYDLVGIVSMIDDEDLEE